MALGEPHRTASSGSTPGSRSCSWSASSAPARSLLCWCCTTILIGTGYGRLLLVKLALIVAERSLLVTPGAEETDRVLITAEVPRAPGPLSQRNSALQRKYAPDVAVVLGIVVFVVVVAVLDLWIVHAC